MHERSHRRQEEIVTQLQNALNSRVLIEQAKGVLAERLGVSIDDAFGLLRDHARNRNARLRDVAADVVAGRVDLATLPPVPSDPGTPDPSAP